ncbi:MAG: sigma-70 family polymerase sigma factor [Planctomycetaceae bacterium]|nr:sigma-70 family polymerase sigma factor [Planctomycetaceae bacterium]
MSVTTSLSLIARVRANDSSAWSRLATLYGPLVYRWARRTGLQPNDATDIVQDVFQSVWQGIGQFQLQSEKDSFRGWLWTITRNEVRQYHRQRANRPVAQGGTEANQLLQLAAQWLDRQDEPEPQQTTIELAQRALKLVQTDFEPRTWWAFWRTAIEGESSEVVATELGLTANAVRQAKYRVLVRLRAELQDQ